VPTARVVAVLVRSSPVESLPPVSLSRVLALGRRRCFWCSCSKTIAQDAPGIAPTGLVDFPHLAFFIGAAIVISMNVNELRAKCRARLLSILSTLDQMETEAAGIRAEPVFADIDVRAEELHELLCDLRGKVEDKLDQLAE
jgi:hypothetical protein